MTLNFSMQKKIDRFVGAPIVGALACWQKAKYFVQPNRLKNNNPQSIVVTKYLGLGSLVHLTQSIRLLKAKYPSAKITVVTSKANIEFLNQVSFVHDIVEVDLKSMTSVVRSLIRVFIHFRRSPADHLYDAEFLTNFSAIVSQLVSVGYRVGFRSGSAGKWRAAIFDEAIVIDQSRHITDLFKQLLGDEIPIGLRKNIHSPVPSGQEISFNGNALVGVNLNASGMASERRWPMGYFAEYLTQFLKEYPLAQIILTGLPDEKIYATELLSLLPPAVVHSVVDSTGKTSLSDLMELISNMDLVISVDSGPLALAAYFEIPTISFWGPESPERYGPLGNERVQHLTLSMQVQCSPCLTEANYKTAPCQGNNICMKQLSPKWAWTMSKAFLEELGQSKKDPKIRFAS